jgi:hypothetical protein
MTQAEYRHQYRIGDAVLADLAGAPIPGVVEDTQGDKILVRLSEPWVNEAGQGCEEVWLTPEQLDPSLDEETGGTAALPD